MKKFLRGFTLTELLICIAIIGIVSAFGANVMKKSTDKAYRTYYKTGYQALYDALSDPVDPPLQQGVPIDMKLTRLANKLRFLFDDKITDVVSHSDEARTRNGIVYKVEAMDGNLDRFIISMQVPQARRRGNGNNVTDSDLVYFLYREASTPPAQPFEGALLPLSSSLLDGSILRFYVDNGTAGRVTYDESNGNRPTYNEITPVSYGQAYCQTHNNVSLDIALPGLITDSSGLQKSNKPNPDPLYNFGGPVTTRTVIECDAAWPTGQSGIIRQYTGK